VKAIVLTDQARGNVPGRAHLHRAQSRVRRLVDPMYPGV